MLNVDHLKDRPYVHATVIEKSAEKYGYTFHSDKGFFNDWIDTNPGNDGFFHNYPYLEIAKSFNIPIDSSVISVRQKLILEFKLNPMDFEDSIECFVAEYNNDKQKVEEIKSRILEKDFRRMQGFIDEVGDNPALLMARKNYNQERAQTGRNPFDPHIQQQTIIPEGYQILNGVHTPDGHPVMLSPEQMKDLRDCIIEVIQQNHIDAVPINLSTVPDPNDNQPIFQNSPQFIPQDYQQQQAVYYNPADGGIPYQPVYNSREQTNPEPQPEAAPVQQQPEQPAQQQNRRIVYQDPVTNMILYEPVNPQPIPPQSQVPPPRIVL